MANHLPITLRQLYDNPAPLLLFGVFATALVLLMRFLLSRQRGWRYSQTSLRQACGIVALLAGMAGAAWGLSYSSMSVQGTVPGYLKGLSSVAFWLLLAASSLLGAASPLRLVARWIATRRA